MNRDDTFVSTTEYRKSSKPNGPVKSVKFLLRQSIVSNSSIHVHTLHDKQEKTSVYYI
jgi:hypothetical protein